MRTLEQRILFDHGLTIGRHLVTIVHGNATRLAIVEIGKRGAVYVLPCPHEGDMYTSWFRVKGDSTSSKGLGIIVWGARNPEIMGMFRGEPVATISVQETA